MGYIFGGSLGYFDVFMGKLIKKIYRRNWFPIK